MVKRVAVLSGPQRSRDIIKIFVNDLFRLLIYHRVESERLQNVVMVAKCVCAGALSGACVQNVWKVCYLLSDMSIH